MLSHSTLDTTPIRAKFPILRPDQDGQGLVYLDSAASSQKPDAVLAAMDDYYKHHYANVHRGVYRLAEESTEAYDRARRKVARLLSVADADQLIFVRNTTEAINLVASAWGGANLGPGDVVLLTEMEHHSNLVPWQLICERTGAELAFIGIDDQGRLRMDELEDQLVIGQVKLVALTHVSNMLGTINPVEEVIAKAHAAGALVLVDGAQGAPHLPVNLTELGADFYAFSGHKMCGPMGSGVLYGRRELLEAMPPYMGGGDMIRTVELHRSTWADIPSKFEAGTPSVADAVGLGAACDFLADLTMEAIQKHEQDLTRYAYNRLAELSGLTMYGPSADERAGVISFNVGQVHPHDVATILDSRGVSVRAGHHCTQPLHRKLAIDASVRASFYVYNTEEDVDQLIEALETVYRIFDRETAG